MTDGGTFNGRTVSPALGITKTARIYYEADTHLLTSGSDYLDLYNALRQACANLTGTGGITSGDCNEVKDAVDAVEMNVPRADPPAAPLSVVATGGSGSASLSWAPPPQPSHQQLDHLLRDHAGRGRDLPVPDDGRRCYDLDDVRRAHERVELLVQDQGGDRRRRRAGDDVEHRDPEGDADDLVRGAPGQDVATPDFTVGATASSGLSVSFTASGTCTVIGTNVHIFGVGTCTITAAQSATAPTARRRA